MSGPGWCWEELNLNTQTDIFVFIINIILNASQGSKPLSTAHMALPVFSFFPPSAQRKGWIEVGISFFCAWRSNPLTLYTRFWHGVISQLKPCGGSFSCPPAPLWSGNWPRLKLPREQVDLALPPCDTKEAENSIKAIYGLWIPLLTWTRIRDTKGFTLPIKAC